MLQIRTLALLMIVSKLNAQQSKIAVFAEGSHRELNHKSKLREGLTVFNSTARFQDFSAELNFIKSDLFFKRAFDDQTRASTFSMQYVTATVERDLRLKDQYLLKAKLFSTLAIQSQEAISFKNSFLGGKLLFGKSKTNFKYFLGAAYDTYLGRPQILPSFYLQYRYRQLVETELSPRLAIVKYHLDESYSVAFGADNQSRYARFAQFKSTDERSEVRHLDYSLLTRFQFNSKQNWSANFEVGKGLYQQYQVAETKINYSNNYSFTIKLNYQF